MKKENKKGEIEKRCPEPIVGALIIDDEGKIFLAKSHKWKNKYTIPGGHIEIGESIKNSAEREVKEETNLDVEMVDYLGSEESINNKGFHEKKHFIFIDTLCALRGKKEDLKFNDEFSGEFVWIEPEKALKLDIADGAKMIVENYLNYKKQKEGFNGWKRCQADFENYKKRQTQNLKETIQFANSSLILEILPVADNFHASTEHIPEDQKDNPWVVGIMHIQSQLEKVLEDNGVAEIVVKEGDKFDPAIMEAVGQEERSKKEEESCSKVYPVESDEVGATESQFNRVKKVLMKGYRLGGKVLRAARVIVG